MAGFVARHRGKLSALLGGVIVLAVGALVYAQIRGARPLPDAVKFVCVATGKTYAISRDKIKRVPLDNPDTGERTLLPCVDRGGKLFVSERYRDSLENLGEKNHYVDPESLAVQTPK
jgi:hypothetical protein